MKKNNVFASLSLSYYCPRFALGCLALSIVLLTGCSFWDLFIDDVEVHNALIQKMDGVLIAEENFYNEYWALMDDIEVSPFVEAYEGFAQAVEELDVYFIETKFASGQEIFVDDYNEHYKDFMDDYLEYAGEFKDEIEKNGYTFEAMAPYFEKLDKFTEDFVKKHNTLIDTINVQADYTASGMSY